ncbi:MAG: hypothetical protein CMJ62_08495 [Planctomycetaceae bacterium]|nr:hypothetical protein [Planctomycetaceae bacterium]
MDACEFTVVIPAFNYGRYLRRAIDSVLVQAGDDYELIVVDDGSTDDTSEIARSYGGRLRYFQQHNQGPYLACRKGYEESLGRYLIFLDADDRLCPDALTHLRRKTQRNPLPGLVVGRYVNIHADRRRFSLPVGVTSSPQKNFARFLAGKLDICTGAAAIHRDGVGLLEPYLGRIRCGMETACVAQTLWHFPAVAITDVLLEVHDHPGRLRDNMGEIKNAGTELVDAVFNPEILPPRAFKFKKRYAARLLRDRARSYHRAGMHAQTRTHFQKACRTDWRSVADFRNARRYLVSTWHDVLVGSEMEEITHGGDRADGVVQAAGAHPVWGHRLQINKDPLGTVAQCAGLGDNVALRLRRPTLVVNQPRDIRYILVEHAETFGRTGFQHGFRQFLRRSLFTREGKDHLGSRRLIQPLFRRRSIGSFDGGVARVISDYTANWRDGQSLELVSEIMELALRVASRVIFGINELQLGREALDAITIGHRQLVKNVRSLVTPPPWLPIKRNRVYSKVLADLDQKMTERIQDRRREPAGDFNLLSELVAFRDRRGKALRDEQISDHTMPTFVAAYEPTANSITAALYLLAKHPEYQRRIHDELDQVDWTPGAGCTEQLPVTMLAIHETLRLFPSGWLISRQARKRHTLPSGAVVKPGTDVYMSPFVIHRDERHYDDPLSFRPERFDGRLQQYRAAGTYLPFGIGPQACLGEYLAKSIVTTAVAVILKDYAISIGSETSLHVESMNLFTIQLNGPVPVVLRRRHLAKQAA